MTLASAPSTNCSDVSLKSFPFSLDSSQQEALRRELEALSDYERFEVETIIEELARRAEVAQIEQLSRERSVTLNEAYREKIERWRGDPVAYLEERLGLYVWGAFREAISAVRPGVKITIESAKGVGKTEYAAGLVHWFLECFEQNEVLTAASKWSALKKHLWPRIHKFIRKFGLYDGRLVNDLEIKLSENGGRAYAQSVKDPVGMQGAHAAYLMQLVEESSGITYPVADAIDGNDTGEKGIQIWIGNPIHASGPFFDRCHKYPSFKNFRISALDHPNIIEGREVIPGAVSRKKIEERTAKCPRCEPDTKGAVHLWWLKADAWFIPTNVVRSNVLGEPPTQDEDSLIPKHLIEEAKKRPRPILNDQSKIGTGCDVARFGSDDTVIADVTHNGILSIERTHGRRTTETGGRLIAKQRDRARSIAVDDGGVGGGVSDTLYEGRVEHLEVNFGSAAANREGYANMKAQLYWEFKEELEHNPDFYVPDDDRLTDEATSIKYSYNSNGQVTIESKEEYRKRTGVSPDTLEAVLLGLYALKNAPSQEAAYSEERRLDINEMPV
jgi:hypothetical protein